MGRYANAFGPHDPEATQVPHAFEERLFDTGEVCTNYVAVGDASRPALLLIPGQTESWWGDEAVLPLLAGPFQAFAVDLRGQGRSTRTPGRYTLDPMGHDLVQFIDPVIGRPAIVAGLSSGGVLSAWLSRVRQLVTGAGNAFEYVSLPTTPHSLHGHDPKLYVETLVGWASRRLGAASRE